MEAYLRFIKEVETLMQINNDTTKDFCSDGMLQCRLCNWDVAFPALFMPKRSHPAKHGVDRFGPPTLERSGYEHRVGRLHP